MQKLTRSLISLAILTVATVALAANPLGVQPSSVSTAGVTSGGGGSFVMTGSGNCGMGGGVAASISVTMNVSSNKYNFQYQVQNTGSVDIDKVTTTWYQNAGSLPDVNYRTDLLGTGNPTTATRSGAGDGDIDWDFSNNVIPANNTSMVFFTETLCTTYQSASGSVTVYSGSSSCTVSNLPNPYRASECSTPPPGWERAWAARQ